MMRVAIVDDDPIVCSSLSTILKATGTADIAWTAYDGETAVGQYEEDNPDVLLIDVQNAGYGRSCRVEKDHRRPSECENPDTYHIRGRIVHR